MRVLIVSPTFPLPLTAGGKVAIFNFIKELSKAHQISLLSLIRSSESEFVEEMKKYCEKVDVVVIDSDPIRSNRLKSWRARVKSWPMVRAVLKARSLLSPTPESVSRKFVREIRRKTKEALTSNRYDIAQFEFIWSAPYMPKRTPGFSNTKTVLVEHDVAFVPLYRAFLTQHGVRRWLAYAEYLKMKRYERMTCPRFDGVATFTKVDKERLLKLCPRARVSVVPLGVDLDFFKPGASGNEAKILYVGSMTHPPNVDAVLYFCQAIFPLIHKRIPQAQLTIVGKDPPPEVMKLGSIENTTVAGYVEDLGGYYAASAVEVVPLRIGGGFRAKIVEAMACGLPIVSTYIGCEGIEVTHNRDILIADTPEEFAQEVVRLLLDRDLRRQLAQNARRLVEEKYDWKQSAAQMDRIYHELVEAKE